MSRQDPFAVTMGRGPLIPDFRWLPPIPASLYQQQKEIAIGVSILFAVLTIFMAFDCLDTRDALQTKGWVNQPWVESSCTIENVGVAYRGTCQLGLTLRMTRFGHFGECQGLSDMTGDPWTVRQSWEHSTPGQCDERGNLVYWSRTVGVDTAGSAVQAAADAAERQQEQEEAEEAVADADSDDDDFLDDDLEITRRLQYVAPRRRNCHNGYLPWAEVLVANASASSTREISPDAHCAFQFGASAPSITGDWRAIVDMLAPLRSALNAGRQIRCWTLAEENCVVAFNGASLLTDKAKAGATLARLLCGIFAASSLLAAALAGHWHGRDHGCCGIIPPEGYDSAVCTYEDSPHEDGAVPLSERVRSMVDVVTTRLGELTPAASSRESLRVSGRASRRTVEVAGPNGLKTTVPRNVAADFLPADFQSLQASTALSGAGVASGGSELSDQGKCTVQ